MTNKVVNIGHGISMLDAVYSNQDIVSIYLLQQKNSIAIIETGTQNSVQYIQKALAQNKLSFEDVAYIIPTHVHLDHAAGAGELMQLCPNAKLIIHPKGAQHMIDPAKLIAGTVAVYGQQKFDELYGQIKPIDPRRIIEAHDNFILDFNGRKLKFLDTPGHARHHFCIWDETSKSMFTGDTFGISYREFDTSDDIFIFPTTTPVQFEPDKLIKSIEQIMSYKPENICLTHFGVIKPDNKVVEQLKAGIKYMSDIAEEEYSKDNVPQKTVLDKIKSRIKTYLLEQLEEMGTSKDIDFCQEKLANDIELNAQGLMVWMARREKDK